MQLQCASCSLALIRPLLGFRLRTHLSPPLLSTLPSAPRVSCSRNPHGGKQKSAAAKKNDKKKKKKDNVWSVDNELASMAAEGEKSAARMSRRRGKKMVKGTTRRSGDSKALLSAAMLMETETVLQTQEPVIKPVWDTFCSSVIGVWKGVGAVFSPITAEMEPVGVGNKNENLYDCYTLSRIEKVPSESPYCQIQRKTNYVALNPFGESSEHGQKKCSLSSYESFDFESSELLEEDLMSMEQGFVFFEDGSYSRGPVIIPVGELYESKYFLSPTFQFEQCLVKGCHKRLRVVHTIEFNEGGSSIQIIRVAVYEEQWVSPVNLSEENDPPSDQRPLSQRRRTQPSELTGSWKVFEVSATPIFSEETEPGVGQHVYLCTEALKKRRLPESSAYFREEEMVDMHDATVLWLSGGVTGYVDVKDDGVLCIGVGWYSDEGTNLVMERDYGMDGRLKEVRWKSEVKRRWPDLPSP